MLGMPICCRQIVAVAFVVLIIGATTVGTHTQHPAMPPGMTHEEHLAQMQKDAELKKRGVEAMGFDQDKTAHHFRLSKTGGAIEVVAKDPADDVSRDQIRAHLKMIAEQFARGDFGKPLATHGELPPGVRTMQERRSALRFTFQELPTGGRVLIAASDTKVTDAVHEFLKYQIREHATGDPLTIS
jgi:hypothetical protein